MRTLTRITFVVIMALAYSCSKPQTDLEYPTIDMDGFNSFPKNCDTLIIGQTNLFRGTFSDNAALGTFSIEIHNNFDHHTHSTDIETCVQDPDKLPVNPFLYIAEFDIPSGDKQYDATVDITIPTGVDPGDYHFLIRLTDAEGWQTIKGISVKLLP